MSILSGLPRNQDEARSAMEMASRLLGTAIGEAKLTPGQQSVVDLMNDGMSLADICGITKQERDAVLVRSGQTLQRGDVKAAQDMLIELVKLEPTDERAVFTLGLTFQLQGDCVAAGRLFAHAIALDASQQDFYLRLGECFMANREDETARGFFEAACIDLGRGPPRADTLQQAKRMLAILDARQAA